MAQQPPLGSSANPGGETKRWKGLEIGGLGHAKGTSSASKVVAGLLIALVVRKTTRACCCGAEAAPLIPHLFWDVRICHTSEVDWERATRQQRPIGTHL